MGLSRKKINLLREFVDYICEECKKSESEVGTLEPHRIKQKGKYELRNIKMVCHSCHEIFSSAQRIAEGTQTW